MFSNLNESVEPPVRTSHSFGLNVPSDEDLVETPQGAAISLYTRRWRDNHRSRVAIGQGGPSTMYMHKGMEKQN